LFALRPNGIRELEITAVCCSDRMCFCFQ